MPSDVSLDILIKTLADTVGADKIEESLGRVSAAAGKSGAASEEAGKGVEMFNVHGREMHRLAGELDRVVPGLGTALRGAFNPSMIGIGALVVIVGEVIKLVQEYKKQVEEAAKAQGELDSAIWTAQEDGARDAAKMAADYAREMANVRDRTNELKTALEGQLKAIKAIQEENKANLAAQEAAEIMAANGDKVKEAEIRDRYKHAQTQNDLKAEEAELRTKAAAAAAQEEIKRQARAEADAAELDAEAHKKDPAAAAAYAAAQTQARALAEELKSADTEVIATGALNMDELRRNASTSQRAYNDARQRGETGERYITQADKDRDALADAEAALKKRDDVELKLRAANKAIDEYETRQKELDAEKAAKQSAANKAQTEAERLTKESTEAATVYAIHKRTASEVQETEDAAELGRAGYKPQNKEGRSLLAAVKAEEARMHGETMSPEAAAIVHQIVAAIRSETLRATHQQSQADAQVREAISIMTDMHISQEDKIRALNQRLHQVESRDRNSGTNHPNG